jgi:hypothetical protein
MKPLALGALLAIAFWVGRWAAREGASLYARRFLARRRQPPFGD